MARPLTADRLDDLPVGRRVIDDLDRVWTHVRESGPPWDDITPAWQPDDSAAPDDWRPSPTHDTLDLVLGHGPFSYVCWWEHCVSRAVLKLTCSDRFTNEVRSEEFYCSEHGQTSFYLWDGTIHDMTGL